CQIMAHVVRGLLPHVNLDEPCTNRTIGQDLVSLVHVSSHSRTQDDKRDYTRQEEWLTTERTLAAQGQQGIEGTLHILDGLADKTRWVHASDVSTVADAAGFKGEAKDHLEKTVRDRLETYNESKWAPAPRGERLEGLPAFGPNEKAPDFHDLD